MTRTVQFVENIQTLNTALPLQRIPSREYPLSLAQEHMWFECQLDPENTLYNVSVSTEIIGPLHTGQFICAVQDAVDRHETLRTTFPLFCDAGVARVVDKLHVQCPVIDIANQSTEEIEKTVHARRNALLEQAYDLGRPPLFRLELLRCGETRHFLVFCYHHLVLDGFYWVQLIREIAASYHRLQQGQPSLPPPRFQYGDLALWQQQKRQQGLMADQKSFWKEQLSAPWPRLPLPIDCPVPTPRPINFCAYVSIDSDLLRELTQIGRQGRTTLFRTLLASLALFFGHLTDQDEVMLDVDFSTRPKEMGQTIGHFANIVPIRLSLLMASDFHQLLAVVDKQLRQVWSNREFPVRQLARQLKPDRNPAEPLSPVLVTQLGSLETATLDLQLSCTLHSNMTVYDLWMGIEEYPNKAGIGFGCASGLFQEGQIEKWAIRLKRLLQEVAAAPGTCLSDICRKSTTVDHEITAIKDANDFGQTPVVTEMHGQDRLIRV